MQMSPDDELRSLIEFAKIVKITNQMNRYYLEGMHPEANAQLSEYGNAHTRERALNFSRVRRSNHNYIRITGT